MEFLYDFGLFTAKAMVIATAFSAVFLIMLYSAASTTSRKRRAGLEVEKINERYRSLKHQMQDQLLDKKEVKSLAKAEKRKTKLEKKQVKKGEKKEEHRIFVLDFQGDIRATAVTGLREEITAILTVSKPGDEVLVKVESGGGLVTSYGLAASQLERLKAAGVKLTISVDKIAASGGYMMACVADHICAAPFAVLGSIGVVAQVPNFNKVLKKHDVDYREITAGEFKRTVSTFGEITPLGLEKFKEQIEETHALFKVFVAHHRPRLDIAKVATGEYWYGTTARELGLCDEITTSDDYLMRNLEHAELISVKYHGRKKFSERLSESVAMAARNLFTRLWSDAEETRFGV